MYKYIKRIVRRTRAVVCCLGELLRFKLVLKEGIFILLEVKWNVFTTEINH